MPRRRTMVEKRDVVRRLRLGHTIRAINKALGIHRTIIRELRILSQEQGWLAVDKPLPDEAVIAQLLQHQERANSCRACTLLDPIRKKLTLWVNTEHLSYVVIHRRLQEQGYGLSEATIRRYIQKNIQERVRHSTIPCRIST